MRRRRDNILVHQPRSAFPPCNIIDDEKEYSAADIHEIAQLPLGNHLRHLRLALRELTHYNFEALTTLSQEYCDDAAPIIYGVPCLQSLKVSARFGSLSRDFNLSPAFCLALASLQYLHTLKLLGLTIPADCPTLPRVEHIQTDAKIYSFESLPRLRDLRQVPDGSVPGYNIPSTTLAQLEILHYCPPGNSDERALLPQVCREMKNNAPSDRPLALRELVLNGYPQPSELLDIVHGLASPHLRTFVCFGLACDNKADYDEIIGVLGKAFPSLTALEFPMTPFYDHLRPDDD